MYIKEKIDKITVALKELVTIYPWIKLALASTIPSPKTVN